MEVRAPFLLGGTTFCVSGPALVNIFSEAHKGQTFIPLLPFS